MFALSVMTYPAYIREKAEQLRREKKMTIEEIAECLAISRTTIYYWVASIPIPMTSAQSAAQRRRAEDNSKRARLLREAAYEEAGLLFHEHLEAQPGFRDFICMYIGEGYKRSRNKVSLNNSDPSVVKLAHYWISRLAKNRLSYGLQYHADQDPDELRRFWASELGIDPTEISLQRKSNSNGLTGRKWRSRYGLLDVRVGDTQLRAELEAWMDLVKDGWIDSASHGA